MRVAVVTPPAPILSWAEIKEALLIDSDDQQAYCEGLAAAALSWIGGPDGWLGRAVGQQTLEARFDCFPGVYIDLPCGPVRTDEGIGVVYVDVDGTEQTLDPSFYTVLSDGRLIKAAGVAWPSLSRRHEESVRVTYVAGEAAVPPAIKQAMLMLVAHWFKNREATGDALAVNSLPFGVEQMLATFRRWY